MENIEQNHVPPLRFPGFNSNWHEKRLREIAKIRSGSTPNRSNKNYFLCGDTAWVKTTDLNNGGIYKTEEKITDLALTETSISIFPEKTILVAMYGGFNQIGRTGILRVSAATNQALSALLELREVYPEYLISYLNHNVKKWRRLAASSRKDPNITGSDVGFFTVAFPGLKEQQKIASFLSAVDDKLNKLRRKRELLQNYKHGLMQQLFSQTIRFKQDSGANFPKWEDRKLSELLYEHKVRNTDLKFGKDKVLSVSGSVGIINQIEHLGRSYAGESVANYHVVHNRDIVYTKSPLKTNPYGIIKANKGEAGIVSTLYAVYSPTDLVDSNYLNQYFAVNDNVNRYLRPLVHKGAKNDMKINNQRVLIDTICCPVVEEQQKIAACLTAFDKKIAAVGKQISQMETFKKGLLQQMFV